MKKLLITGCSNGMGLETVKKFLDSGYLVFGLDIKENDIKHDNFKFYKCDVTSLEDIYNCYNSIKEITENLDTIINFAGIYDLNSLVEISEEDFIRIFNINLFGCYRINKVFLPLLKPKSKIIITSSELAPLDPLPFTGLYGITKAALEKYAYSLRMELQLLNIDVIVIRPGAVETKLLDVSTKRINDFLDNTKLYKTSGENFLKITNSVETKSISPAKIANLAYKIDNKKHNKYVYSINRNFGLKLLNCLPDRWQNKIIKKLLTKKGSK